ncbi:hypothetical protein [Burkholderia cepacia]|uniref:hypothetical protein n=1 Tax=Burkholderia cepacia TaxID=292 RepID=UPI00157A36B4|nr:hypothetical protein [Burkholderia cepacia]MCA8054408.1 hypothetical protein [Burkholderia cepacia]NTX43843.1 hypothetical protein [Burkholderia cepacia]
MEIVAQHLQQVALAQTDPTDRDHFGRSAFNRYYYATFLHVKAGLGSINPDWNTMAHAGIPEVLRGSVQRELKRGRTKAQRTDDAELVRLCSKALSAVSDLADLMEKGYATRVAADYHPEILVDFSGYRSFKLNTVPVEDAHGWPYRARALIDAITLAWTQIHV